MQTSQAYEVWWSKGDGTKCGPSFPTLEQALEFIAKRAGQASFAIRQPDQTWFRTPDGTMVFSRWHESAAA